MRAPLALALLLAASACLGPRRPAGRPLPDRGQGAAALAGPAGPVAPAALPNHAAACRPVAAQGCDAGGCADASEGLHAEQFELDLDVGTLGACLYTDCYTGAARVVREPGAPWRVTAFGEVHSERPEGSVPPPGSAPFPIVLSVDLRDGRFTAVWALSPAGLQVDFGTCQLRRDD